MSEHKTGIFVSHASEDDELVSRIHDTLTEAGFDAWVDHEDRIGLSADWINQIQEALNRYQSGLLVLSCHSIKSHFCRNEWLTLQQFGRPLYVALLEPIPEEDFPWWLRSIQHVDLGADFEGGAADSS